MNINSLLTWAKPKPTQRTMTPYEATQYQQGYVWGQLGFNPNDIHIDYNNNKLFAQGWVDATNNTPALFDKSFATPALFRGGT